MVARAGNGRGPVDSIAEADNARRLEAFRQIDNSGFTIYHLKVALVSGAGFFTDAYDIFAIEIVATILGYLYGSEYTGSDFSTRQLTAHRQELAIKIAAPCGMLVGQLVFGFLGDVLGRKRTYGLELLIMIIATFGQTVAAPSYGVSIIGTLVVWRVLLGLGIGGDYPLSAVIASEFASIANRGRLMTAVFANQGLGQLTAAIVALCCTYGWKSALLASQSQCAASATACAGGAPPLARHELDMMWRLIIGFGCVPGAVALYFRMTIPETPRFTMDVIRNVQQAEMDADNFLRRGKYHVDPDAPILRANARAASRVDFCAYFAVRKNWTTLVGTAYSWFALDIAFYGLGLNVPRILSAMDFGAATGTGMRAVVTTLQNITVGNLILTAAGYIPGFIVALFFIDRWGRRNIQITGFFVLTILFIIMAAAYQPIFLGSSSTAAAQKFFVFLYVLANFFQNFGPNTTTFIVPGEMFPTRYRSTAHGLSAASGKLGAIISQIVFTFLVNSDGTDSDKSVGYILYVYAAFMASGGVVSWLMVPETMGRSLEELSNESQADFIKSSPSQVSLMYNLRTLQAAPYPYPYPRISGDEEDSPEAYLRA